jgi:hypothetical protein
VDIRIAIDVKITVENCQNIRLEMVESQHIQEGFKAPYRGLPPSPTFGGAC